MCLHNGQFISTVMKVVNVMLALWVATELLQLVRLFMPVPKIEDDSLYVPSDVAGQLKQTSHASARQLAEMHIFGPPVEKSDSVITTFIDAPDTELNIVLHGTFASSEPRNAHAIIADNSGREESYAVGEEITNGITVHDIHADRVILWHNQRYETLRIPDSYISNVNTPLTADTAMTSHKQGAQALPVMEMQSDSLNDLINTQPARINGEFIGFQIGLLKDNTLFEKSGLQKGDIITWINEVDLDNPLKAIRALNSITSGDYVNMTVRREGENISLSFHMP